MLARPADTDPESEKVHLDLLRRAGPGRRAQMALSLSCEVIGLARRAIQRSLPDASPLEVQLRLVALQYGPELSAEIRLYLAARSRLARESAP
jgi:hypothetical protein